MYKLKTYVLINSGDIKAAYLEKAKTDENYRFPIKPGEERIVDAAFAKRCKESVGSEVEITMIKVPKPKKAKPAPKAKE